MKKKDRNIVQIVDVTKVLRKKGSRESSLVRVYHLSVEYDLLSMPSEFTPYSSEAETYFGTASNESVSMCISILTKWLSVQCLQHIDELSEIMKICS